jgi:DNA-binding MarR family transcriptional regulator
VPRLPFDPIAEAHRRWLESWPEQADRMAAVTSVMRVQQMLLTEIERVLRPYGLTFASYEALRLLAFTRHGELPMGKIGERLMVHPASVTNTVDRLQARGLVRRRPAADDRRRILAELTPEGRELVGSATTALNKAEFALGAMDPQAASAISALLRVVRLAGGDFEPAAHDPWAPDG